MPLYSSLTKENTLKTVFSEFCMFPSELKRLEEADNQLQVVRDPEPAVKRYSKQRSWRPALETIDETL